MTAPFGERLAAAVRRTGAPLCVGLDPDIDRIPPKFHDHFQYCTGDAARHRLARMVRNFNQVAIEAAASSGRVAAVKPQFAFYERLGSAGWEALEQTCRAAREAGLLVIADAKRGDIASTADAYAGAILDPEGPLACDAVTLNPWMGTDTVVPFLEYCWPYGTGVFVLLRTTNPGSAELQLHGTPPAAHVLACALDRIGAEHVGPSGLSAVGAVVGALVPDEARVLRSLMPSAWFLVPGYGAQGGTARDALAGVRPDGLGVLVNASRSALYPANSDPEYYDGDTEAWLRRRFEVLAAELAAAAERPSA